jgi:hypothetical protein
MQSTKKLKAESLRPKTLLNIIRIDQRSGYSDKDFMMVNAAYHENPILVI